MLILKRQRGFTIIEGLIAISLFAVVMPTLITATIQLARLNDRSADLTSANIIAERQLETLRSAGYNTLIDGTYSFVDKLDSTFTDPRVANYTITTEIPGLKSIDLYISYTDYGKQRELKYSSLISEIGIAQ